MNHTYSNFNKYNRSYLDFHGFVGFHGSLLLFIASLSLRLKFNKPSKENPRKTARRLQQICNKTNYFPQILQNPYTHVFRALIMILQY